uniref:Calmodulin n=1 Tax=Vitrella brassicaformis TaxID=1169539 RepID=A0A7S1P301_9ALVE|mmetsp:Transcript_31388/g.77780  ORF Transcript_31388/g.77780 Transcript_31388/m.77780 type:complete len:160 (+) Transcript_31388:124-603(+)
MRSVSAAAPSAASSVPGSAFHARRYERPGLTVDEIEEIKEAFDLFDVHQTNQIDAKDLKKALLSLGLDAKNQTLYHMVSDLDEQTSHRLSFEDFLDMMTAKTSERDTKDDIMKVCMHTPDPFSSLSLCDACRCFICLMRTARAASPCRTFSESHGNWAS